MRESAAALGADPLRRLVLGPGPGRMSAPAAVMDGVAGCPVCSSCSGLVRRPVVPGSRFRSWWLTRGDDGGPVRAARPREPVLLRGLSIRCARRARRRWSWCKCARSLRMGGGAGGPRFCGRPSAEFERRHGARGDDCAGDGRSHPLAVAGGGAAVAAAGLDTPGLVGLERDAPGGRRRQIVQHPAWVPNHPGRVRQDGLCCVFC